MSSSGSVSPRTPGPGGVIIPPAPQPRPTPAAVPPTTRPDQRPVPIALVNETCQTLEKFGAAGHNAAARLRHVVAHIHSYTAAEVYATLDPEGTQDSIVQGRRAIVRLAHWLSVARNVLILLPLLLTWAGLYWATKTYQADVNAHAEDLNHPFLELWQNGFHSSSSINGLLSFSHLALADVVLFVLLIIVGLGADIAARRVRADGHVAREQLERCAASLGDAAGQPSDTHSMADDLLALKERIEQILGGVAAAARQASENMRDVTNLMQKFQQGAQSITDSATMIVQQASALTDAVTSIRDAAGRMANSAGDLSAQASGMRTSQDMATKAMTEMLEQHRQVAINTDKTAEETRRAMLGFSQSLSQTEHVMQNVSTSLESSARMVGTLMPLVSQVAQVLKDLLPRRRTLRERIFGS